MSEKPVPTILILAGGKGTRLKHLASETPKYLMPIDDRHVFADLHIEWLRSLGFQDFILSIGHLGEKIQNYCGTGEKWGVKIRYLPDGPHPLGTGGAVRNSLQFGYDELCVTYGDTLLNFSFREFLNQFRQSTALGAMTLYENNVEGHVCNATLDRNWVVYDKLNPDRSWRYIDYGFLLFKRSLIESFPMVRPLDLSTPLSEASREKKILGFIVKERFWEIGSPEALSEFQQKFRF